jgi:hypothetical protein
VKISAVLCGLLLLIGWLIGGLGAPARSDADCQAAIDWRRTAGGWENAACWREPPPPESPRLHPGVVASFCLLASLLALTAGSRGDEPTAGPTRS